MLVPVVNLGVALWAAFTEWPVTTEVERLKLAVASADLKAGGSTPVSTGVYARHGVLRLRDEQTGRFAV